MLAAHHQLSIVDQVKREDQSAYGRVNQNEDPVVENDGEYAEEEQHYHGDEQETAARGEIPFRLESEQCEGEADRRGYPDGE